MSAKPDALDRLRQMLWAFAEQTYYGAHGGLESKQVRALVARDVNRQMRAVRSLLKERADATWHIAMASLAACENDNEVRVALSDNVAARVTQRPRWFEDAAGDSVKVAALHGKAREHAGCAPARIKKARR